MSGSAGFANRGLIPRSISHVFKQLEVGRGRDSSFTVRVSYLEIYNEALYDLLSSGEEGAAGPDLAVFEDKHGGSHVRGLTLRKANTEEEALAFLFEGETNRALAEHQLNKASTRSHCMFTLYIERVGEDGEKLSSKLNLVDLAGSERVSKTASSGETLEEAKYINKSLTFLEQVVIALIDKSRDHVPYRSSKLTNVLKDSLGGNCRTRMISCVWPELAHLDESLATLRFSTRMMRVTTSPAVNVLRESADTIARYEREIHSLRQELVMHDALSGRTGVRYGPLDENDRAWIAAAVNGYVRGDVDDLELVSVRHIKCAFQVLRDLVRDGIRSQSNLPLLLPVPPVASSSEEVVKSTRSRVGSNHEEEINGDAPVRSIASTRAPPVASGDVDLKSAWRDWKHGPGVRLHSELKTSKASVLEVKEKMKQAAAVVNQCKQAIDSVMARMSEATASGADAPDSLLMELKTAKKAYRTAFQELTELKSELSYVSNSVEQYTQRMRSEFKLWCESTLGIDAGGEEPATVKAPRSSNTHAPSTKASKRSQLREDDFGGEEDNPAPHSTGHTPDRGSRLPRLGMGSEEESGDGEGRRGGDREDEADDDTASASAYDNARKRGNAGSRTSMGKSSGWNNSSSVTSKAKPGKRK